MNGPCTGLLLDFGGVISVTLFERHIVSEQALGLPVGALTWRGPFDPAGDQLWADMIDDKIAEREYWACRAAEVGRLFGEDWDMQTLIRRTRGPDANRHIRAEAERTIRRAKAAGRRVGILSNELELFYGRDTVEQLEILKEIDSIVDATHTHILKPDPRAYKLGCEALGLSPDQVLFIDDQSRNVDGAGRAGLEALQFDVTRPALSFAEAERRLGLEGRGA
ncbi:HAD-IA family hydrolase [Bradyrhizobium sp.]|uniref:HAD-IA family hydrolase n=1 Tax=Bradyrhizobium sp. TaxID=376 RepID=UPI00260AF936|nr:HAD-IA family hydrolase [Bradyrhizobium sp.]